MTRRLVMIAAALLAATQSVVSKCVARAAEPTPILHYEIARDVRSETERMRLTKSYENPFSKKARKRDQLIQKQRFKRSRRSWAHK